MSLRAEVETEPSVSVVRSMCLAGDPMVATEDAAGMS